MRFQRKIKASSLQLVIVVSVIIVILLFAFISLMYLQKRIEVKHQHFKEAVYTTQQYFKYIEKAEIPFGVTDSLAIVSSKNSNTTITKKQWGLFELMNIKTTVNNDYFQKTALIGASNLKREALYLKDNNQQLIVVGNTTITGGVSIPSRGINSGNIGGVSYNKQKYVFGKIKQSSDRIPEISNKKNIENFISGFTQDSIEYFDLSDELTRQNSFLKKTLVYQQNGLIDIINTSLNGNFIIESDSIIRVHASSTLKDVILIAPKIEIMDEFKGNLQLFATKKIVIGKKCFLEYPSAIVLLDTKLSSEKDTGIIISKAAVVKGVVINLASSNTNLYTPQILLDLESKIYGEVYSLSNLELKGEVYGSVYTNSFIARQSGGIYMNHIYNGVINSELLDKHYSGLFFSNSTKSVAKWLD